jgi:potassium-transporting ATPase KdpC subunit
MKKNLIISTRLLVLFTLILGFGYTGLVTLGAQLLYNHKANGSLIVQRGKLVGSTWIAQGFVEDRYFWPRPSASSYGAVASGASNQGPLSKALKAAVDARRGAWSKSNNNATPAELLLASGSGLDPHVSPSAALDQVPRVAQARQLSPERVSFLVAQLTEGPTWGFLGEARVNVLMLNLALDDLAGRE